MTTPWLILHSQLFTMKAFILLVAASAGGALAHPTTLSQRDSHACPDLLYGSPTCCSIDIQGIADRDCNARKINPLLTRRLSSSKICSR